MAVRIAELGRFPMPRYSLGFSADRGSREKTKPKRERSLPGFRRRVPANAMRGYLEIKQGAVQELEVEWGLIGEEVQHYA